MLCTKIVLNVKTKQKQHFVYTACSAGILSLQFSWTMNNLLSYCWLDDTKISASDLPVLKRWFQFQKTDATKRQFVKAEQKVQFDEAAKMTYKPTKQRIWALERTFPYSCMEVVLESHREWSVFPLQCKKRQHDNAFVRRSTKKHRFFGWCKCLPVITFKVMMLLQLSV